MSIEQPLSTCPDCSFDLAPYLEAVKGELSFCVKCKFPLMLVAGKYRLLHILGEGGFSHVYKAVHVRMDRNAERVIKVIKPELLPVKSDITQDLGKQESTKKKESPEESRRIQVLRKRFSREVQLTAAISQANRHIVRVYDDFGEIPNFGYFYVMEYLEGKSLGDYIQAKELPSIEWCVMIFQQLCDAMQTAHEEGIIHRDLKPDNLILIRHRRIPDFLKVIDFGIAKPMDSQATPANLKTKGALGSPFYMSPEQCTRRPPDARSDVYAMGIILFQLLTGQHPFVSADREEEPSIMEMLYAHLMNKPPSLREIRPDRNIPEALEKAVLKALAKKPEHRIQSAEEFSQMVESALNPMAIDPLFSFRPKPQAHSSDHFRAIMASKPDVQKSEKESFEKLPEAKSEVAQDEMVVLSDKSLSESAESKKEALGALAKASISTAQKSTEEFLASDKQKQDDFVEQDEHSWAEGTKRSKGRLILFLLVIIFLGVGLLFYFSNKSGKTKPFDGQKELEKIVTSFHDGGTLPHEKLQGDAGIKEADRLRVEKKHLAVERNAELETSPSKNRPDLRRKVIRRKKPVVRIKRRAKAPVRRFVKISGNPRCNGMKGLFIQVKPYLHSRAGLNAKGGRVKRVRGGFCVSTKTKRVSIEQKGYNLCFFYVNAIKKRLRVCLLRDNVEVLSGAYCLKKSSCRK